MLYIKSIGSIVFFLLALIVFIGTSHAAPVPVPVSPDIVDNSFENFTLPVDSGKAVSLITDRKITFPVSHLQQFEKDISDQSQFIGVNGNKK